MTKIIVDGNEIEVPPEYTLLQACEAAARKFRASASTSGCRSPATAACASSRWSARRSRSRAAPGACATAARPKGEPPEVKTRSPMVKKAREGVMEFLLINHPLDCPICDQGGECDLQDQAMAYGVDASRYRGEQARGRRQVSSARWSRRSMNRCIQCTRCVRFIDRGRRRAGDRRDRPRRGHGDHDLSRAGDDLGAAGQRHRPLPGRRADLEALRLQRAAVGAEEDRDPST